MGREREDVLPGRVGAEMSADLAGETIDLRAAILARCDELERLARNAGSGGAWAPDGGRWEVDWTRRGQIGEVQVGPVGSSPLAESLPPVAAHIATWSPQTVLALVAGARELCEIHQSEVDMAMAVFKRREVCASCRTPDQWRDGQNWGFRRVDHPCPTLAALAQMLGIEVSR